MNGLPVGTDGTFKDYCDVIRTAGEGAPIGVEVLRFDTSEVLKGEINGDRPIELAFSFAEEVGDEVGEDSDAAAALQYESVTDDPARSTSTSRRPGPSATTAPVDEDGVQVPYIAASTDLDGFLNGFTAPGLLFAKLPATADVDAALAQYGFPATAPTAGSPTTADPVFTGKYQLWQDCAGTANDVVTLVAVPADGQLHGGDARPRSSPTPTWPPCDQAFNTFNAVS